MKDSISPVYLMDYSALLFFFFKCAQSSRRKNLNSLEQKIKCLEKQRKEVILQY